MSFAHYAIVLFIVTTITYLNCLDDEVLAVRKENLVVVWTPADGIDGIPWW